MTKNKFTLDDDALLKDLGVVVEVIQNSEMSPREERILNGFQEIMLFYKDNGRIPTIENSTDVIEKKYAIRLTQMRRSEECLSILIKYDTYNLLKTSELPIELEVESLSDDELLNELGINIDEVNSVTKLKYVKPKATLDSADEVASRSSSPDFDEYKPLFSQVIEDIRLGHRQTSKYKDDATIIKGDLFILGGQIAYIAEMGEEFTNKYGRQNSRMRVIFDNGTHTEGMLMRSFQRALNKDGNARRIEPLTKVSLFSDNFEENDSESGTIYVLRSKSNNPVVYENRDILHKIGVTGSDVRKRVSNAKYDSTFLMADVEIVAEYRLANINRMKLEGLIHKFFSQVQMNIAVQDRFGKKVNIKEWFLAPIFIIDQMIELLKSGELSNYYYDRATASIQRINS